MEKRILLLMKKLRLRMRLKSSKSKEIKTRRLTMKTLYISLSTLRVMATEDVVEGVEAIKAFKADAMDQALETAVIDAKETTNHN